MASILLGNIKGPQGDTGATGPKGDTGNAATIAVGSTTTVPYGQAARVTNTGTPGAAVLNFVIPQGKPGEQTSKLDNLVLDALTEPSTSFPVPAVGDTGSTLFGKISKWFSDMSARVAQKFDTSNVVNNLTTTNSGYALDARAGKALSDNINNVNTAVVEMYNALTLTRSGLTKVPSTVTVGSLNNVVKYGRIVHVSIVFSTSQAAAGDTILFTTPYQIRFPFIASIRKDLGGEYLIGTTSEDTPNIRALYGEDLPAGTYRGSFVYITT